MKPHNRGGLVSNGAIRYNQDALWVTRGGSTSWIASAEIIAVIECQMQDEIAHADEYCHIIRTRASFWLVGPFVEGAPQAIHTLLRDHPEHRLERVKLLRIPWGMRAPGLFGWRLWPIAGLGHYPNAVLKQLTGREARPPFTPPCPSPPRS